MQRLVSNFVQLGKEEGRHHQQDAHALVLAAFQIISTSKQGQESVVHLARFSTAQIVDEEFGGWVSAVRSSLRRDSRREQRQSRRGVGVAVYKVDIVGGVRQGRNCALDGVHPRLVEEPKPGCCQEVESIPKGEKRTPTSHFPPQLMGTH